jgi:hypothetical protein
LSNKVKKTQALSRSLVLLLTRVCGGEAVAVVVALAAALAQRQVAFVARAMQAAPPAHSGVACMGRSNAHTCVMVAQGTGFRRLVSAVDCFSPACARPAVARKAMATSSSVVEKGRIVRSCESLVNGKRARTSWK